MKIYTPLSVSEEVKELRKQILRALESDYDENAAAQILTDYVESVLAINNLGRY